MDPVVSLLPVSDCVNHKPSETLNCNGQSDTEEQELYVSTRFQKKSTPCQRSSRWTKVKTGWTLMDDTGTMTKWKSLPENLNEIDDTKGCLKDSNNSKYSLTDMQVLDNEDSSTSSAVSKDNPAVTKAISQAGKHVTTKCGDVNEKKRKADNWAKRFSKRLQQIRHKFERESDEKGDMKQQHRRKSKHEIKISDPSHYRVLSKSSSALYSAVVENDKKVIKDCNDTEVSKQDGELPSQKNGTEQTDFKGIGSGDKGFTGDEKVEDRVTLIDWDPKKLFEDLYKVELQEDNSTNQAGYLAMEGFMEKLPINKRKATLLKTWKRRYFKAIEGNLYYYETSNRDKANGYLTIIGGSIENLGERMIGIDDGRGRYLIVRCPTENEFKDWQQALTSQTSESIRSAYIKPVLQSPPHKTKKVIIVDIGSCSVRAGILGEQASLPQVFFPTIVAIDKETKKKTLGFDAYKPEIRKKSTLVHPVKPSAMADKYSLNFEIIIDIFQKVFAELRVDPSNYLIMLSTPGNYTDKIKEELLNILVKQFKVKGVNIVSQTLLAMYSYSQATSGIVVDIGDRLEIVPITDGFIQEGGKTREAYGGHRIGESLNSCLTEAKYRFFTEVEFTLVRLALEKTCYVSQEYETDVKNCKERPELFREILDLTKYDLPAGTWTRITHDLSRFKSPEGLFQPEMWGMDTPPLHKLIQKAILACPMDTRREMWRSIFLSGGGTLLPGFAERLQAELTKLVPKSIKVQIHASPQRYHAAYIGACNLASMKVFENACITADEWKKKGAPLLRKWHMY